jgi:hypothetical protein
MLSMNGLSSDMRHAADMLLRLSKSQSISDHASSMAVTSVIWPVVDLLGSTPSL